MKKVGMLLAVLSLALFASGAMAQGSVQMMGTAQQWQNNAKLPGAILDTFAVYNGAATLRKCAIGTKFLGLADDTIRVVAAQSAAPRRVRIMTDTSTVAFGANKFRMDSCAYGLASGGTATALAIGDIDGDGYTDILTANTVAPFRIHWFEWDGGTLAFEARDSFAVNAAINDIIICDANNDGNANEIVFNIAQTTQSCIMRALWTAPGVIDTTRILLTGTQATRGVAFGEVRTDLPGGELYVAGGTLLWMVRWDGAAWTSAQIVTGLTAALDVAVGDIDPTMAGNEIALVHGSTSYQVSVTNWTGTAWAARLWNLTGSAGTADCDIAIGDIFNDNPGNEVALTLGNTLAPRAFWISPVGGAWARALPLGTTSTNYGVAIGNVNKYSSLASEFVMTGMGGRIVEGQQRANSVDLGTQAYRMTNGAFAKQGATDTVEVNFYNAGADPASNFYIRYRFKTSALTDSVLVAGPLASGASQLAKIGIPAYDFTGFDTMYVFSNIAGDANPVNDTTKLHIEPNAAGDSAQVWSGFNTAAFAPSNATYSPVNPAANEWKATILTGSYNWRRVTSGTNPTIANLEGAGMASFPCYSATAGSSARLRTNAVAIGASPRKVKIKFYMYHDTGYSTTYDSVYVQYSFDDVTWSTAAGFQRYNAVAGWQAHDVEIGDFPANNSVHVGLYAVSKYGNNMFIDSVRAYTTDPTSPMTDAGVTAIAVPGSVAPGQPFTVTATIRNFGLNTLTGSWLYCTLGGADTIREAWYGNLEINQTAQHAFAQQLTLPDSGNYTIYAGTELAGDENPANDATSRVIRAYGIYSLPYVQDFNDATWLPADCDTLRYASGATVAGIWTRETVGTSPACTPYEGAAMAKFNSFNAQSGNQVMFISPRIATGAANAVGLSFAFYGDPGYPTLGDSILIDITTDDGATWTRGVAGWWRYAAVAEWRTVSANLGGFGNDTIRVALRGKSAYGNNMFVDQVSIFDAPPAITYTSPDSGAADVPVNAPIVVAFSEPIEYNTFFWSIAPDPSLTETWNAAYDTVTLVPISGDLAASTEYTFAVTGANDLNGNPLAAGALPNPFTFTTAAVGDTTAPAVVWTTPANGATDVALDATIQIVFSEPMDTLSIMGGMLPAANDQVVWNATMDTLSLTHDPLAYGTTYTISWTAGTDLAGNPLAVLPDSIQFTTIANQGPAITMTLLPGDSYDGSGPFMVRAVITDPAKAGVAATAIYYSVNGTAWNNSPGVPMAADTFNFGISGPIANGSLVSYYLRAIDDAGDTTYHPANAPIGVHQFRILDPLPPTALVAQGLDMAVQLNWAPPAQELNYAGAENYIYDLPAGFIGSVRYTPMHYPCKLEQLTSLWFNASGMDSVIVHVYADDGTGMPDEATQLVTPFAIMPLAYPTATVVDLSGYNIVLGSGEFHVGYELRTAGAPRYISDGTAPQVIRSLYYWPGDGWYGDLGYDWNQSAVVSYSTYTKGLALKSSHLRRGQKPNYRLDGKGLKPVALTDKREPVYGKLTGALAMAKGINFYMIERSATPGGPYASIGNTGSLVYLDSAVANGTPYYYVVYAHYSAPDTFSAVSNEATATPAALPILVVDDDLSHEQAWQPDRTPVYTAALDAAGQAGNYTVYQTATGGADGPGAAWYSGRTHVIWFTAAMYEAINTLTDNDEANLAAYLDGGGRLFLCGQDYLYDRYPSAGAFSAGQFPYDYLGVASVVQDDIMDPYNIAGVGLSLADGQAFAVVEDPSTGTYADDLTPLAGAMGVFDATGVITATQYSNGTFRTVFSTTLFEDITDGSSPNTKGELMYRILNWLSTGVEANPAADLSKPAAYSLAANYPNPVRGATTVKYALPKAGRVSIGVYNVMGQKVKTLVDGTMNAGYHAVSWNGRNESGQAVSAGVYLYKMQADNFSTARKLVVVR